MNIGGITYNAASIAAGLKPDYETLLVAGIKDESEESSEFIVRQLDLEPVMIPDMSREINLKKDFKAYLHILKIIKAFKPDIVHTHAAKAGMIGRLAAWRAGVPVIIHTYHGHVFHSYFSKIKTKIILTIERFLGRISTGIIAISEEQKRELGEVYKVAPLSRIHIIELGYALEPFYTNTDIKRKQFRAQYHLNEETVAIGIIGRIVPIKNLRLFVEVIHELFRNQPLIKIKALIIGDGEERFEIQQICKDLNLSYSCPEAPDPDATVLFTSWIYEADIAMAGLDIVALTSLNEGTPASLIEAQAAGKPIVSTLVGGIANIVKADETALLVPSGDKSAFVNALLRLINDPALRKKMGEAGPEFAKSRFNDTRLISDIQELYTKLAV